MYLIFLVYIFPFQVVTRMYEGMFRNRAGSVPTRQPMLERRRHRTQSEGEKDLAEKDS